MSAAAGAAGVAAAAAAVAEAIKASGVLVRMEPEDFQKIVERNAGGLVITAQGGLLGRHHDYLTSYKGLAFYTRSDDPLALSGDIELVTARKIWIPS